MAIRRMMSRRVIDSARFMRLPAVTRELYFQMLLRADDDGVVEAWTLLQLTRADESALEQLEERGFIRILNDDLVCYLCDWREHNIIRADRKTDSIYRALLEREVQDVVLVERTARAKRVVMDGMQADDDECTDNAQADDGESTDNAQADDGVGADNARHRLGKDRLGKDRSGEDRERQDRGAKERKGKGKTGHIQESERESTAAKTDAAALGAPTRGKKLGKYGNVRLTEDELAEFRAEHPLDWTKRIDRLDAYIEMKGTQYCSHLAVLREWAEEDRQKAAKKAQPRIASDNVVDPIALASVRRLMENTHICIQDEAECCAES